MSLDAHSKSILCHAATMLLCVLLVCGHGLVASAQNTIYTVAGGASWSNTALSADLAAPGAVAKDAAGNVYVAEPSAHDIFKIDTSGNLTVFAGLGYPTEHATSLNGKPATQASLDSPAGVAVDKSGNVYIADTVNYMIRKVNTGGTISTIAGNTRLCQDPTTACGDGAKAGLAQLNYPIGVANDSGGNVYIADTGDNRIRVVNMGTATITVAGVSIAPGFIQTVAGNGNACANSLAGNCGDGGAALSAQLNNPQGVAVDAFGNIYISDSGDRRIRIVSTSGVINAYAGTGNPCFPMAGCGDGSAATLANLSNPWQIALDPLGDLFIVDAPTNLVREVSAGTQIINTVAGNGSAGYSGDGGSATAAMLNHARGVAVDASGNVMVADTGNERIRLFTVGGNISTLAGGGSGWDGGVATSAILGGPRGVGLDSNGNLYIADSYDNAVREVTPSGPPSTYGTIGSIAGTRIAGFSGDGGAALSAEINFPVSVVVNSLGNVYVSDSGNLVIRQYTPSTGVLVTVAGTPQTPCSAYPCGDGGPATEATFANLTSITLDGNGNIYAADAGTHTIRVINMGSSAITVAGVNIAAGYIDSVAGTSGSPCANPLSGQCGDNGPATSAQLNSPFGVAVDTLGDIFIADTGDNRVREVVASGGNIVAYAFKGASNFGPVNVNALAASYGTPHYLAIDPHGNLYVSGSDFYSVVVRVDTFTGLLTSVAGVASNPKSYGFSGDGGLSTLASINNSGLAVDGGGHLYIADEGNNRVREVLLTPTAALSVNVLNFPPQTVDTTSAPLSFTLTNDGLDDLYISSEPVSAPFHVRNTTCGKNVVAPNAKCTINITYRPTATGPVGGSITINDNAYGSPSQTVTLNGTGQQ
jgi:trimeric autotransporter adhesin